MPAGGAAVGPPSKPAPVLEGKRKASKNKKTNSLLNFDKGQIDQLGALHYQYYAGKEEISCHGCGAIRAAIIEAGNGGISFQDHCADDHDNHPTTCLQVFFRVQCQRKAVFKNGNINPKMVSLTEREIDEAMSRASTTCNTPAVGTPSFNEDDEDGQNDGVQDTQVYKPGPQDGQNDEGDEMIEEPSVAVNPKPKRGRGRPKGSKNKVSKARKATRKATIGRIMKGLHLVPKTPLEHVALIPEHALRLVLPWYIFWSCKG